MRVYLPTTIQGLRGFKNDGALGPVPVTGFAVTSATRDWYPDNDIDELEYAAFLDAARASLRLLDADSGAARRRVVVSVDVDSEHVAERADLDRSVVRVNTKIPYSAAACVHIDGEDAQTTIDAAVRAVLPAELGDPDAEFTVDSADEYELEWYDISEVDQLLSLETN